MTTMPLEPSASVARPPTTPWKDLDHDLSELVTDTIYPTLLNYQVPVAEPLLHYYTAGADESLYGQIGDSDPDGNEHVEMLFPAETAKLIVDEEPLSGAHRPSEGAPCRASKTSCS